MCRSTVQQAEAESMLVHSDTAFASPDAVKAAAQAALARQAQAQGPASQPPAVAASGAPPAAVTTAPQQAMRSQPAGPQQAQPANHPLPAVAAGSKGRKRIADPSG